MRANCNTQRQVPLTISIQGVFSNLLGGVSVWQLAEHKPELATLCGLAWGHTMAHGSLHMLWVPPMGLGRPQHTQNGATTPRFVGGQFRLFGCKKQVV